jgi:DNA-binding MarR family transcriptional regulator/DNA replicative helicase MCM subunit Mcm2 (Cdc46/Mcm family)
MKYPKAIALFMRIVGKEMALPPLDTNPFSTLSLESGDSNLLVGRQHMLTVLSQYMKFRSTRRILLVGEHGSGRTSLLRCASKTAPISVHIDRISRMDAGLNLLKDIYSRFVNSNVPESRNELTMKILEASQNYTKALPLIVIDASTVDVSALNVALRDTLPTLERIQAVIVVVLETKDKAMLHESVLQRLDQMQPLANLSLEEVQLLVERRIQQSTGQPFSFDQKDAQHLLEQTSGLPSTVIRVMRDAIDNAKMSQYTHVEPQYESNTSLSEPLYNPSLFETPPESSFDSLFSEPEERAEESIEPTTVEDVDKDSEALKIEQNTRIMESIEDINLFDLDLVRLTEDQDNQAELKILESVENLQEGYDAAPAIAKPEVFERPPLDEHTPKGMAGIIGRSRDFLDRDQGAPPQSTMVESGEGVELWEDPSFQQSDAVGEEISEEDSAFMLHDEVGFMEHELESEGDAEAEFEIEAMQTNNFSPLSPSSSEIELDLDTAPVSNGLLSELAGMVPVMKALQRAIMSPDGSGSGIERRKLVEALEALQRKPTGSKQDYALNATVLSALTGHEIAVISLAHSRRYSPSDEELLGQLDIKRARLSQISNRLLKAGILSVRTLGRNRYYELTQAARAQLIAWNVIGGEN